MRTSAPLLPAVAPPSSSDASNYLLLRTASAAKLGLNSTGRLTYRVLCDAARQQLYLSIAANDGGGYFSAELVPFSAVEASVEAFRVSGSPLPAKRLASAFRGRSANNGGFMAAILRAEELLAPAVGKPHQHVLCGSWDAWKAAMLALPGDPFKVATAGSVQSQASETDVGVATAEPVAESVAPDDSIVSTVDPDPAPAVCAPERKSRRRPKATESGDAQPT